MQRAHQTYEATEEDFLSLLRGHQKRVWHPKLLGNRDNIVRLIKALVLKTYSADLQLYHVMLLYQLYDSL